MLAAVSQPASSDGGSGVCVELSVVHNRRWHSPVYLDYVGLAVSPLKLQLEQNTSARLLRFAHTLAQAQSKAPSKMSTLVEEGLPVSFESSK